MSASRNVNIILNKLSVVIISNKVKGNVLCTHSNVVSIGNIADRLVPLTYARKISSKVDEVRNKKITLSAFQFQSAKNKSIAEIF